MSVKAALILIGASTLFTVLGLIVVLTVGDWGLAFSAVGVALSGIAAFTPTKKKVQ